MPPVQGVGCLSPRQNEERAMLMVGRAIVMPPTSRSVARPRRRVISSTREGRAFENHRTGLSCGWMQTRGHSGCNP